MQFRLQILGLGAGLTIVTGLLCALFPNCPLWAPGILVAFVINGGAHERHLGPEAFWAIAATANLAAYIVLAGLILLALRRMRGVSDGPRGDRD